MMSEAKTIFDQELKALCDILGISVEEALQDLKTSLEQRISILMRVEPGFSKEFVRKYLKQLLKAEPADEIVFIVQEPKRRVALAEDERLKLQARQKNRCGLCGSRLFFNKNPHVDHVVPISRMGTNQISNLQLRCSPCNLGKGAYFGWPLAAPFYEDQISPKVRYFVLSRSKGQCEIPGCLSTSENTEIKVTMKISRGEGGRSTIDNLISVCREHNEERTNTLQNKFRNKLRDTEKGVKGQDEFSRFSNTFRNLVEDN